METKEIFKSIICERENKLNTVIYVDYENLIKRLKEYGVHPIRNLDFFRVIAEYLHNGGFNIVDFTAYANFDDKDFKYEDQTRLQSFGINTIHTCNDGKTSSDIELVVDALTDLHRNSKIDVFVLISSDRDFISLIKAIKLEGRVAYVISTKNGFNDIVKNFANYHEYIEDIFDFESKGFKIVETQIEVKDDINLPEDFNITEQLAQKSVEISQLLYSSSFWSRYKENGEVVGFNGYANIVKKNVWRHENLEDIELYFKIAAKLEYISFNTSKDGMVYFEEGKKVKEIMVKKESVKK